MLVRHILFSYLQTYIVFLQIFYPTVFFIVVYDQTTQSSSYSCFVNNTTIEFSLVTSSFLHSALNIITNCSIPQCNGNSHDCRTSQTPCFDYRTQDNISYCAPGNDCSILEPCNNTCSSSTSICVINTCSEPKARCLPLFFTTFCPSMSVTTPVTVTSSISTSAWSNIRNMSYTRAHHTSSVLSNGTVLVAGGNNCDGSLNSAELYDPTTGVWTLTGYMTYARYYHTLSVLLNGKVLVAGGDSSSHPNSAVI